MDRKQIAKEVGLHIKKKIMQYGYSQTYEGGTIWVQSQTELVKKNIPIQLAGLSTGYISLPKLIYVIFNDVEKTLGRILNDSWYLEGKDITLQINFEVSFLKKINNENDIVEFSEKFETSFTSNYLPAFEHYSNPKNVLVLWDRLDTKGRSDCFFSPYNYIKIIILSKMCNDEDYERRCLEAIDFYTKHYNNGIESAKELIDTCHKVINYLAENNI